MLEHCSHVTLEIGTLTRYSTLLLCVNLRIEKLTKVFTLLLVIGEDHHHCTPDRCSDLLLNMITWQTKENTTEKKMCARCHRLRQAPDTSRRAWRHLELV
uniref:Uncharacterized protein n=1 Tax=Arion vulgaris TaxID=1028688 RepID=A0A0B6ZN64_9EUPU